MKGNQPLLQSKGFKIITIYRSLVKVNRPCYHVGLLGLAAQGWNTNTTCWPRTRGSRLGFAYRVEDGSEGKGQGRSR